jgi:hypothetical protein
MVSVLVNVVLLYTLLLVRGARQYMSVILSDDQSDADEQANPNLRRFIVIRDEDVTGISGTGNVVEGVVFSDGWGVSHWLDRPPMNEPKTEIWHRPWYRRLGPDPFTKISGHGGKSRVVWIDKA